MLRIQHFFIVHILSFILLLNSAEAGLELRNFYQQLKTSIIIPCHNAHFTHIPDLLKTLQNQTVIPDEVVISLSNYTDQLENEIYKVENIDWGFRLVILRNPMRQTAGQNRNQACLASSGDLLICQDADDIPHPQRIEIIKYLFEMYKVDHLLHLWSSSSVFRMHEIYSTVNSCSYYYTYDSLPSYLTNGTPSMLREVFDKIQWQDSNAGEDVSFNRSVYNMSLYKVCIREVLYCYRQNLSSSKL